MTDITTLPGYLQFSTVSSYYRRLCKNLSALDPELRLSISSDHLI